MFTNLDTACAPYDIDEAHSSEPVPERFVLDSKDDLDAAWGDWLELTHNSEGF